MTIWRMRVTWWIPKANSTHSEYVILIAFSVQQLHYVPQCYTYITCLTPVVTALKEGPLCDAM